MANEPDALQRFQQLYKKLTAEYQPDLSPVYSADVRFQDPFVALNGRSRLAAYLASSYANVIHCRFDFGAPVGHPDHCCLPWTLHLRHRRLRGGQEVKVDGISLLMVEGNRIRLHRDYFDAGQMLYENLPLLGSAVRWLRRHAA